MPRGRMIDKRISDSKKLGKVSDKARVLYFMLLPHLDKNGAFKALPGLIKWTAMPNINYEYRDIEKALNELHGIGLLVLYKVNGDEYLRYIRFREFQTNDPNKEGKTDIPEPTPDLLQTYSELTPDLLSTQVEEEDKGEDKGEDKEKEQNISSLWDYFLKKTGRKYQLTNDRKDIIRARLDKFTLQDLTTVIDRFASDDWVDRPKYMDITYCFGKHKTKLDVIEKWLNMKDQATNLTAAQKRTIDSYKKLEERWAKEENGTRNL